MSNEPKEPRSGKEASGFSPSILQDIKRIQAKDATPPAQPPSEEALSPASGQTNTSDSALSSQPTGEPHDAKKTRTRKRNQPPSFDDFMENLKIFDSGTSTLNVVIPKHVNTGALLLAKQIGVDKRDFVIAALQHFMKSVYNKEDAKQQVEELVEG